MSQRLSDDSTVWLFVGDCLLFITNFQAKTQKRLQALLHSGGTLVEHAAFMPWVCCSLGADAASEAVAASRVLHVLQGGLSTGA